MKKPRTFPPTVNSTVYIYSPNEAVQTVNTSLAKTIDVAKQARETVNSNDTSNQGLNDKTGTVLLAALAQLSEVLGFLVKDLQGVSAKQEGGFLEKVSTTQTDGASYSLMLDQILGFVYTKTYISSLQNMPAHKKLSEVYRMLKTMDNNGHLDISNKDTPSYKVWPKPHKE